LFDEGISAKGRTMQEQLMNLDLKAAYEESIRLAKGKANFSIDMLKGLSAIVMKNTGSTYNTLQGSFDASKGDLRLVNVTAGAGGRSYMNFMKVPIRLADFCTNMNERRLTLRDSDDIIEQYLLSFDAHYELVTIHPWADGNGRMSRLIMNHLQFEYGLVPTKVNKDDKAEYIQALVDSREQNTTEPFREFMLKEHIKNLQHEIATYNESANEVKAEGGQKTEKVDRKGGQKTREAIMKMITKDSKITSTQMAEILGINRSAVSKHLKKMQEDGIIKREGPDKGGKWVVL
ncbi:MAG: Fic family protein, partial [Bacteroidaceae bacterium]|nr:Fic family protein [Bacteroidaceae bacterium]